MLAWLEGKPLATAPLKKEPPPAEPLILPRHRAAILSSALSLRVPEGAVSIEKVVAAVANGKPVIRIERLPRPSLRYGIDVLADVGEGMLPYANDRHDMIAAVRRIIGSPGTTVRMFRGSPLRGAGRGPRTTWTPWRPTRGVPLLLLSDLGIGGSLPSNDRASVGEWLEVCARARHMGTPIIALVPYAPHRWPGALARQMRFIPWDRGTAARRARYGTGSTPESPAAPDGERVLRLAEGLSLAAWIDSALLRKARLVLEPEMEAGVEADLWFSDLVESSSVKGFVLRGEIASELQKRLAADPERLRAAWSVLKRFHPYKEPVLVLEERVTRLALEGGQKAERQIARLLASVSTAARLTPERRTGLARWAQRAVPRMPQIARQRATVFLGQLGLPLPGLPTQEQPPQRAARTFEDIYAREAPLLRALALRLVQGSGEDVDDLVQDVFIALMSRFSEERVAFDSEQHLHAWLVKLLLNSFYDRLRRKMATSPPDDTSTDDIEVDLIDDQRDAEVARHELEEALGLAVQTLPVRERQAISQFLAGNSYQDIAKNLELSTNRVVMLLARARQQLRQLLDQLLGVE
jgi:RNA polymerase sigma factor (sigma-70 family)